MTATRETRRLCGGCGVSYDEGRFFVDSNGNKMCPSCYRSIHNKGYDVPVFPLRGGSWRAPSKMA